MMFLVTIHRSGPQWDASKPLEEQSGWTEHASFMDGLVDDGFIVLGGPLADEFRVAHAVEAELGGRCPRHARARSVERDASPRRLASIRGRSGSTRGYSCPDTACGT